MSNPSTEALNEAFRQFYRTVKDQFTEAADGEPQVMVDRVFAAMAAIVGALLLVLPGKWRKDGAASALLAAAIRLWSRERKADDRHDEQRPHRQSLAG